MQFIAYSFIKKVSSSLGTEKLRETLKEVKENNECVSVSLIDLAVKIDFYRAFPFDDFKVVLAQIQNNFLPKTLLKMLALNHLYMFSTDYKESQKIFSLLDVSVQTQKSIMLNSTKKNKLRST